MKKAGLLLINLIFCFQGYCQQKVLRQFGKVHPAAFSTRYCPMDSNASAYYIFDESSSMVYAKTTWHMEYHRHYRIHLLARSAHLLGQIAIPLFMEDTKAKEEISVLKVSTFNLVNGKVVETQLDKKNIIISKISDQLSETTFKLPAVGAGSIIEVEYTIQSDFWNNLRDWEIQQDIPVLQSDYTTVITNELVFKPYPIGGTKVEKMESGQYGENSTLTHYSVSNVPAFLHEPFISNKRDYHLRVEFELESGYGAEGKKQFSHSWNELDTMLLKDENFGKQLFNNTFLFEIANKINKDNTLPLDKIKAAYQFIHRQMKWNGKYGIYPALDIQKSFTDRIGNAADINLLLIKLLKVLDIPAAPVVLSTVKHGKLAEHYPSLEKLNYLIVAIPLEDNRILLDAADPYASFDLIPPKCFNGQGLMLNEQGGIWIDIKPYRLGQIQTVYKFKLNPDFVWEGDYLERDYLYSAYTLRNQIKDSSSLNEYIDFLHDLYPDIRFSQPVLNGLNDTEQMIQLYAHIKSRMGFTRSVDSLTFAPIQIDRMYLNPFKSVHRTIPVTYEYPWMTNTTVECMVPEGYIIDKIPGSVTYQNPGKTVKFTYMVTKMNDSTLVAKSLFVVNQPEFVEEEFPDLNLLFDLVIKKQAEVIVFKKKE